MDKRTPRLTSHQVTGQEDISIFTSLLKNSDLPFEDIVVEKNHFFLYRIEDTVVGCGGLEFYGNHCLLRSVAVAKEFRNKGYGKQIMDDLIAKAEDRRSSGISLLTETAEKFFEKLGFRKQSRDEAPRGIKLSSEFSAVCPVSAVLMVKRFELPGL